MSVKKYYISQRHLWRGKYFKIYQFFYIFFFSVHILLIDIPNIITSLINKNLDISKIAELGDLLGHIIALIILLTFLGLNILFGLFYEKSLKKYGVLIIFIFLICSIITIFSTSDLLIIFYRDNPIDFIKLLPEETNIFLYRAVIVIGLVIFMFIFIAGSIYLFVKICKYYLR